MKMKLLFCLLLALRFAAVAADTNPPPRLTVELRDGSRIVGASVGDNFKFHSSLLGAVKLAVQDIRTVDCLATNSAKLTAVNGDVLLVALVDPVLKLKTGFGKIELATAAIRKITVTAAAGSARPRAGLVALWSGEDNADDSIGGRGLTMTDIAFAEGKCGRAFALNGRSSCLELPDNPALNPGANDGLTISAWIKPEDVTGFHPILEWNPSDKIPGQIGVQLWLGNVPGSQGVLAAHLVGAEDGIAGMQSHSLVSRPGTVQADVFQHVAVTYDRASGAGVLYLNGVVVTRGNWGSFQPLTTGDLWISRRPTDHPGDWTYDKFFNGLLDEIAIYARALSAEEIRAVCLADNHGEMPPPPATPGLGRRLYRGGFGE